MWGNTDTGSMTSIDLRASFYTSEEKSPITLRMESVYQTDRDHYTKKKKSFQEQRETWNCHDVTISVNVSLAWYLLLLNFDLKDELADDLSVSPSTVTGDCGRGELLAQYLPMDLFALGNGSTE